MLIGNTEEISLRYSTINILNSDGIFSVNIQVKAVKGAEYVIELYAADTESADDGDQIAVWLIQPLLEFRMI